MRLIILCTIILFATSCSSPGQGTNSQPLENKQPGSIDSTRFYPDAIYEEDIQKAQISKSDSTFRIIGNIKRDYRIFGYEKPDTNSTRLILFSVFTRDVKDNPYKCPFGAFYSSGPLNIRFKREAGNFIQADLITEEKQHIKLFFQKKWIEFVE